MSSLLDFASMIKPKRPRSQVLLHAFYSVEAPHKRGEKRLSETVIARSPILIDLPSALNMA
jgi:hypothetical protein